MVVSSWVAAPSVLLASDDRGLAVIPPGYETLLAGMVGRGEPLPGSCELTGAGIDRTFVRSRYRCGTASVTVELRHPNFAPVSALRTERFAIVIVEGSPSPELAESLARRIRAREAEFAWTWTPAPEEEAGSNYTLSIGRAAAAVTAVLVVGVLLGWRLQRRIGRNGVSGGSPWIQLLVSTAASLAVCALVHTSLRLGGASLSAIVGGEPWSVVGLRVLGVLLAILGAAVAGALLARAVARPPLRLWALFVAVVYVAVGYGGSLEADDLNYFGSLSTYPPNAELGDTVEGAEAPVRYRINSLGFRHPDFRLSKPAGTLRIVLIGDSFVFGIGVNYDGTLRPHLENALAERWPDRAFDIVNLGIPGNNLASHVVMFEQATRMLAPDVVILGLTLANDLSAWDEQDARRDLRSFSAYSFARFLIGDAVQSLWALLFLEREATPAGLTRFDEQVERLTRRLGEIESAPVVVLFGFHPWVSSIADRLSKLEGVIVVPNRTTTVEDFIPGDGHPTSFGNRRSAFHIVETLSAEPSWRSLVTQ